jgi:hypothetical protein
LDIRYGVGLVLIHCTLISITDEVLRREAASQVFFRVSKLIHRARSNSQGYVDHIARETSDPFIRYAFKGLGPSLSGRVVLLPAVDLDRNAELPLASLRFLHLGAQGTDKETVDIPFESLFALNRTDMPAAPQAEKDNSPGLPPYVVSWDGRATLFIIFRDSRNVAPEERKLSRGWFCELSQNTLVRLGLQ